MTPSDHDATGASLLSVFRREREGIEDAFAQAASAAGQAGWEEALQAFGVLERRLRRQIQKIETSFLPLFEIKAGSATELTRSLVLEHREIESGLERLAVCLREQRLDDVPSCVRGLRQVLEEHDGRAGRLFYPLLDRLLTDDERRVLLSGGANEGVPGRRSG